MRNVKGNNLVIFFE